MNNLLWLFHSTQSDMQTLEGHNTRNQLNKLASQPSSHQVERATSPPFLSRDYLQDAKEFQCMLVTLSMRIDHANGVMMESTRSRLIAEALRSSNG